MRICVYEVIPVGSQALTLGWHMRLAFGYEEAC